MADFNREYFESIYRDYRKQNPEKKIAFYRRLAEAALTGVSRPRLLDIGCAFGYFLTHLDAEWDRFGIDASPYAIERAGRRDSSVRFAVFESGEFPFQGPFDLITAFDVLEHVGGLEDLINLISRNLRKGGGFLFVVPVYDGPTGPIIRALDQDPTHLHRKSRDFWLDSFRKEFDLADYWGIYRYLLPGGYYLHHATHVLRRFTPAIACLMRRR